METDRQKKKNPADIIKETFRFYEYLRPYEVCTHVYVWSLHACASVEARGER